MSLKELERQFKNKYVVVDEADSRLRRFSGRIGLVKTVNGSGLALVEFLETPNVGWYDIDPRLLKIVEVPSFSKSDSKISASKEQAMTRSGEPAATKGLSPLELARAQGAAKASGATAAASKSAPSPLELARQQGAAKQDESSCETSIGGAKAAGGKPLSPLELARMQGAAKAGGAAVAASKPAISPLELARQQGAAKRAESPNKTASIGGEEGDLAEKPLSPLELARMQGAAKRDENANLEARRTETSTETEPSKTEEKKLSPLELARQQGAFKGK